MDSLLARVPTRPPAAAPYRGLVAARLLALCSSLLLAACTDRPAPPRVFAAASIADAVRQAAAAAGVEVSVNAAASSTLAQQIEAGAEAAVFVSAHGSWLDRLAERGLLEGGSRRTLVGNSLVWIAPRDSGLQWSPEDGPPPGERLALGDPEHVPAGRYARQGLERLGWWAELENRVLPAMDVRAALAFVARGEAPIGIVYRTDVLAADGIRVLGVLPGVSVTYELATVADRAAAAAPVLEALTGASGRAVFARLGFELEPTGAAALPPAPAEAGWLRGDEWQALRLSLQVGLLATLTAIPFAVALAYWLARTRSRLRVPVEAVVVLPMVLPPVVVGYFLLVLFGRQGFLPTGLPFSWLGAALAAFLMGFPLMVRALRQAFENVDPALEQAAATLGARPLRAFFSVTLPLSLPGLVAGSGLCFARSLGEFGATITFAGNLPGETRTLPLAIWTALQTPDREGSAWRLTLLCVAVSLLATLTSELLLHRQRRGSRGDRS